MESGDLAENHPFLLAYDEVLDPNLGELAKPWDDRTFGLHDVPDSRRNNITLPPGS